MPVAATLKLTELPAQVVCAAGCVVIVGAVLTVRATLFEVSGDPQVPLTTTL